MDNQSLLSAIEELLDKKLEPVKTDIRVIKDDIYGMKEEISNINQKINAVYEQVADLTEFKTDINNKLDYTIQKIDRINEDMLTLEEITSKNWNDIIKLKRTAV